MKASDINNTLLEAYLRLLSNLNLENKLELISRLTQSMKKEEKYDDGLANLFGAWKDRKSGEQLIEEIRSNRNFNQSRETL